MDDNTPSPQNNTPPPKNDTSRVVILGISPLASLLTVSIPGLSVIAPLIVWLIWKDSDPAVDTIGRNVLNSQISWAIWGTICFISIWLLVGIVLYPLFFVLWIVFTIINAIKISNGEPYIMPATIEFLKQVK